jgi:hypothetical protein
MLGLRIIRLRGTVLPKEHETAVGHISWLAVCSITTYLDTYFDICFEFAGVLGTR